MFGVLEVRQGNAALGAHNAGHAGKALADGLHRFRRAAAGVGKPQFAVFIGAVFCQAQLFCLHVLGLLAGDHLQKAKVINANI